MARTVVVVDDSKFLARQITEFFVKTMGYTVVAEGNDGDQAVELYRMHTPDLITLDITMPNKNGKAALNEILREFPGARILMISAVKGSAMLECIAAGAKGFVEKPLKLSDAEFLSDFIATVEDSLK